jgi:hypothetical protein
MAMLRLTHHVYPGLGVLFEKLQQGARENRQVLTIARMRAEAEEAYSNRLSDIVPTADKANGGFSRDDGATVRKVRPTVLSMAPSSMFVRHIVLVKL